MKTAEELRKVDLPKWPFCRITGTPVSEEQALEIIRRVDLYFGKYGHYIEDKEEELIVAQMVKMPLASLVDETTLDIYKEKYDEWSKRWRPISLEYLYTDWIVTSFIGGFNGWMHPDGEIEYHYNIGKWPEVKEVEEELKTIVAEFPFLELECTLHSEEYCDEVGRKPLVSFLVRNGEVELVDPAERDIHAEFNRYEYKHDESFQDEKDTFLSMLNGTLKSPITLDVIRSWSKVLD